jgi:hypothetical protein
VPRVNLGKPNHEAIFGARLKAIIFEKRMECRAVANAVGFTPRTMSNRFNEPELMTLKELKKFIKITGLPQEVVIQYLYENQ